MRIFKDFREFANWLKAQEDAGLISTDIPEDLQPLHLILAYAEGSFPMPDSVNHDLVEWHEPAHRAIVRCRELNLGKSSLRKIAKKNWTYSENKDFVGVMRACADRKETWISEEMIVAYENLFKLGFAKSFEVWDEKNQLIGGVYGVDLGMVFCAESMFRKEDNASKAALMHMQKCLMRDQVVMIDVQFMTPFLKSIGVKNILRSDYRNILYHCLPEYLDLRYQLSYLYQSES